ncbi:serine/threonine-protein kinase [Actinomadura rupiterrae]|uniref:serine/threonine-protein kinase n=1 Tax=Actinomadura rupiterrae TaxID=559627 RepID=UPI0020A5F7DB|nr:serine/threonine-protein kinase [Actinomadura rupiterrae]MCP2343469.1 hypothetical protein [Actinomadura rupiterrae]
MDGWRVPGFTTVRTLGQGGQGSVVLARHDASGTLVAIKYVDDRADRALLRREAAMLGRAASPHVARLFQLVETAEGAAIVMEAVDGVPLRTVLERHGALAPEAALTVLKGSLLGLAAAHGLGVVHRDYKPANVVVPPDGRSKLIDFGIAVTAGRASGGAGTPAYMAPEQWRHGVATPATDVYAATCVFFECVTGRRPFAGGQTVLEHAHVNEPPPVEAVPEPLRNLVAHGMAKDPARRPPSASAFVGELEAVASAVYGPDWEGRGVRALAASAAALASLFPIAALLGSGGGAAGAGVGASAAGTSVAGAASQGLLASTTTKIALGVVATVLVAGGGAAAVRQYASSPAPKPRPTPTPTPTVQLVASKQCKVTGPLGDDQTPKDAAPAVKVPVRLPVGAALYRFQKDTYVIGPSGQDCSASSGNGGGGSGVGSGRAGSVQTFEAYSLGTSKIHVCLYFPDSPDAAKIRRTEPCTSDIKGLTPLDTGDPGVQAVTAPNAVAAADRPPSPYVSVVLALLKGGSITCVQPLAKADICTAALTYYVAGAGAAAKKPFSPSTLEGIRARIARAVAASKR